MKIWSLCTICAVSALSLSIIGCDPESASDPTTNNSGLNPDGTQTTKKFVDTGSGPILLDALDASNEPIKMAPEDGDEVAVLVTGEGRIVLMFHPEVAPNHVANFKNLINSELYDGTRFHRTIKGFVMQGGDPNTKSMDLVNYWGTGDNVVDGRKIQVVAEFNDIDHVRGVLSMARGTGIHTASCQFYIVQEESSDLLNDKYTAFGRVVEGIDVVDKIIDNPTKDDNGTVFPNRAVVLEKATIETWPLGD